MNEYQIQKGIIKTLEFAGWMAWLTHRPGAGYAVTPGQPDLIAVSPEGVVAFIEVKGPRTQIKPIQQAFMDNLEDRGALVFVAGSEQEVIDRLGLPYSKH